jgi:hypothetical protein
MESRQFRPTVTFERWGAQESLLPGPRFLNVWTRSNIVSPIFFPSTITYGEKFIA